MKTAWKNGAVVVLLMILAFGGYKYRTLSKEHTATKADLASKVSTVAELQTKLAQSELEKTSLNDALTAEQAKNNLFADQIARITGTVGSLERLSKTDPELLKKYSKVYFLNENYEPTKLVNIDGKYLNNVANPQFIHADVKSFLEKMVNNADGDGMKLKIISGFRSFGTQASLKSNYKVTYGAGTANQFSADQGYSEHQLGTTVDFTTPALGANFDPFDKTPEYKWLVDNAYKYGFVLSYPKKNGYYQYEPWHWRFVGIALAENLHRTGAYFYDLDQRDIDKYLINLFDTGTL